jgi:hypothetical protein
MLSPDLVSPAAQPEIEQTPDSSGGVPEPVNSLINGTVPAFSVTSNDLDDPAVGFLQQNLEDLGSQGIDYVDVADDISVFYNRKLTSADQLRSAAQDGSLAQVAPPISGMAQSSLAAAVQPPQQAAGGLTPTSVSPTGPGPVKQASATEMRPLAQARAQAVQQKAPSERKLAGQGAMINAITARPV